MASTSWGYEDSDDETANEAENEFRGGSVLIVMIDSTPAMFEQWKEGEDVPFKAAVKCCQAIWRNKVVSEAKDLVSLLFVGTDKSKNTCNFENLYQLQELSTVKVEMIDELNTLKQSEDFDGFEDKIGSSANCDMKDVFWLAKIIIDEGKAATHQKKIMYFTTNDNPHAGKSNLQKEAVKKFKDIGKVEFTIVAFKENFQLKYFYSNIVDDESDVVKADNVENLMKIVRVKQRLRRPISRSTFEIASGVKMGVGFYSFVRPAKKPRTVVINKRTNAELEKSVTEFHTATGMSVLKSEERKMVNIQGEQAVFTKEEIKQAKQVFETGVTLVGFINSDDFDGFAWYRSPCYFMYPDEESISGSKDLFVALLKRCHALKKVALVKMVLSRGRSPKLACLIPSLNDPLFPQGFHVFPIPFCSEMRQYDFEFKNRPSQELVELMEKVIKKITNKGFDILDVYNPMLQNHWRELERIALDMEEDDQDDFHDFTEPNEELMLQRLGNLPNEVNGETNKTCSMYDVQKSTRPITTAVVNMAMEVKHKRVEKLTIPVLKQFLDSNNVKTFGLRKAQLVEAVYKHFQYDDNE